MIGDVEQSGADQAADDAPDGYLVDDFLWNASGFGESARKPEGGHHGEGCEDTVPAQLERAQLGDHGVKREGKSHGRGSWHCSRFVANERPIPATGRRPWPS